MSDAPFFVTPIYRDLDEDGHSIVCRLPYVPHLTVCPCCDRWYTDGALKLHERENAKTPD